jgi:hypothetical protein
MDDIQKYLDLIKKIASDPTFILVLEIFGALLAVMILIQGLKWLMKAFWPAGWHPKLRTMLLFSASFYLGYRAGLYFIDSEHVKQWAIMIGLANPVIYYTLVQYARVKNRIILLSVLKMRPVVEVDGKWKLHDTQTFTVKQ